MLSVMRLLAASGTASSKVEQGLATKNVQAYIKEAECRLGIPLGQIRIRDTLAVCDINSACSDHTKGSSRLDHDRGILVNPNT